MPGAAFAWRCAEYSTLHRAETRAQPLEPAGANGSLTMPRVSLAMPVFNGENFIESAIASILAQDFADFELIITDNASSDRTEAICRKFAESDARVRYHRNPKNLGAAPNYNLGFELASGEYLKWCAHDDLISENYLSECVKILDENPDVALVFGRTQCIDDAGAPIPLVGHQLPALTGLTPARRFGKVIRFSGTCFEIFGLFRLATLKRTSLHRLYYGSDRALLAETALLGDYALAEKATFYNREHGTRSINIDDKRARRQWQFADARKGAAFEHLSLLNHLFEIARRHADAAPVAASVAEVATFALKPMQMGRYLLEAIGAVSPGAQQWLRRRALGLSKAA
ncbi:MAG: glycosyltransferase family 2 protein [Parvularculaceae bacterium]